MQVIKRIILTMFTGVLCISGSVLTYAQSNTEALQNIQQELNQNAQEKQSVTNQIQSIQQEVQSLNTYIAQNQAALDNTQQKMAATNKLIEAKKQEIVTLEDKILARKEVMKKRIVALQHDDNLSIVIKVFLDSKNLNDFIQRASAVSTLLNADQDIMAAQKNDLSQIETAKKEIDRQEQVLEEEQKALAKQQADLDQNLQTRQETLTALQEKFSQIDQQMALAKEQKANIESQIQAAQEKLRQEQATAAARTAAAAAAPKGNTESSPVQAAGNGEEMYVTATAYNPEEFAYITTSGYNIKANPNMKLIAVDPNVISLGKHVWVEGYGVAIAGDTGGAIKGHRIDVLMPTRADALVWGIKAVKIVVLD
ncbi:3D domain-containing protein [Bacillus sp. EB600]|uniref:3D domain-containing protein n=1 Tax=Bacillus sp. EB600 TaxID=2806345 RepID=UPI00210A1B6F|nr:3D domain-containing protein [Bacillus sp. EB600]MCQ6277672.1 cell wall-binding protein [Bacillus sp. EB600]